MAGRLPDRRRRVGGARDRDRGEALGRAGARRRGDAAADPGAAGDGQLASHRRRDGVVASNGGWRALNVPRDVEDLLRELAPQVLGVLARRSGDFDAAEDAVQEALLAAAVHWPRDGVPDEAARLADPDCGAAADRPVAQRPVAASAREPRAAAGAAGARGPRPGRHADRVLHVLPPGADAGLGDRAHAARGRRADARPRSRARSSSARRRWRSASRGRSRRIKASGVPFQMPTPDEQAARLRTVLHVLYLIFNEGYTSSSGPRAAAHRAVGRGDPADAGWCTACFPTTARSPACSRSCCSSTPDVRRGPTPPAS